jgi:hypothetical protein
MRMIEQLTEELGSLRYPPGIDKVCADISGPAFFPGGKGLVKRGDAIGTYAVGTDLPVRGIMILGNNFDNCKGYRRTKSDGTELPVRSGQKIKNVTWRNLLPLLNEVNIDVAKCFFTNAFMGVTDSDSNRGSHEGHRNKPFHADCHRVFLLALKLQCPRLVVTLGLPALQFVSDLISWGDCAPQHWARSWSSIDRSALPMQIRISECPQPISVVPVVHPCFRPQNVWRRTYLKREGKAAEIKMLKDAIQRSRMS